MGHNAKQSRYQLTIEKRNFCIEYYLFRNFTEAVNLSLSELFLRRVNPNQKICNEVGLNPIIFGKIICWKIII